MRQNFGSIAETAQAAIAMVAQQATNAPCQMIMVNMGVFARGHRFTTDSTEARLLLQKAFKVRRRQPELSGAKVMRLSISGRMIPRGGVGLQPIAVLSIIGAIVGVAGFSGLPGHNSTMVCDRF